MHIYLEREEKWIKIFHFLGLNKIIITWIADDDEIEKQTTLSL